MNMAEDTFEIVHSLFWNTLYEELLSGNDATIFMTISTSYRSDIHSDGMLPQKNNSFSPCSSHSWPQGVVRVLVPPT
jgi:hypothetical protein